MKKNRIFLRLATEEEREYYRNDYAPCMIGDAELTEDDVLVVAYLVDRMSYPIANVALFIYEEVSEYVIDNVCIVNLHVDNWFPIACRNMFAQWRLRYNSIRIPADKYSPIVQWCDKLYERIEEDEDSIIFDGNKLVRKGGK